MTSKPKVGAIVDVKMPNRGAIMKGPVRNLVPEFFHIRGKVCATPEWADPTCFAVIVPGSEVPLRVIDLKNVVEIDNRKVTLEAAKGEREVKMTTVKGSRGNVYEVTQTGDKWTCTCPGFTFHHFCKHIEQTRKLT